jgi:hypothetical protein
MQGQSISQPSIAPACHLKGLATEIIKNIEAKLQLLVNDIPVRHHLIVICAQAHHTPHRDNVPKAGTGISDKGFICIAGHWSSKKSPKDYGQRAIGIDWMTVTEMSQSIPPAYTRFLGKQLIRHIEYDLAL